MKQTKFTFVFSLLILLLASCSGNNNTPEAVALSFTKDIYTANFDKTKKVCTEEAKKVMDMFPAMMETYIPIMKKSNPKIEIKKCDIDESGTEATVTLNVINGLNMMKGKIDTYPDPQTATVYLQKEEDKWLVSRFK